MTTVTVPDAIVDRIRSGQRFLITSHMNPDGDAVGTAVGLARLLAAGVVDDLARLDRRDDARPAAHLLPVRGAPHRALPPGLCLPVLVALT